MADTLQAWQMIQAVPNNPPGVFELQPPGRFALVDRFYREQGYKVKCAPNERVYTQSIEGDGFVAAARLVPQASGHYWLRNLLVKDSWRGQGLAKSIMRQLLLDIAPNGCYCFALPHLKIFYQGLGFILDPADCPDDIAARFRTYRSRGRDWLLMGYQ